MKDNSQKSSQQLIDQDNCIPIDFDRSAQIPYKPRGTFFTQWPNWFIFLLTLIFLISIALNIYTLIYKPKEVDYPFIPFLDGWTSESLKKFNTSHGFFPNVTDYLHPIYVREHLKRFVFGASLLATELNMIKYGREWIGKPDNTLFVTTHRDMDGILARANGNITLIEEELGIPYDLWKGKKMVRIDVLKPFNFSIRMPTGNEQGANELWMPGGYLPTGIAEAVLNRVPKGAYTETEIITY